MTPKKKKKKTFSYMHTLVHFNISHLAGTDTCASLNTYALTRLHPLEALANTIKAVLLNASTLW